jgi:hypothetical protein
MNFLTKISLLISVFFTGEVLLNILSQFILIKVKILVNGACPSIEECNKCSISNTECQINCKYKISFILLLNLKLINWTILMIKGRECYFNTYISIFFQEINKCPFEHCSECPVDQYGCKTMC